MKVSLRNTGQESTFEQNTMVELVKKVPQINTNVNLNETFAIGKAASEKLTTPSENLEPLTMRD